MLAPTHVIFDLDGTLLDTEPLYTRAAQSIVSRFGKIYDWSIKRHTVGGDPLTGARFVVATLELPLSPEAYLEEREAIMRELCKTASPRPGAASLVERLHQHGVPLAIGTSSSRELCEIKLAPHAFSAHFRSVVCSDDPGISGGKPAPDIFLKAASELGAEPARCLVFEDTEKGMQAAVAAGMPVIVTPDPGLTGVDFSQAALVLPSLAGLTLQQLGFQGVSGTGTGTGTRTTRKWGQGIAGRRPVALVARYRLHLASRVHTWGMIDSRSPRDRARAQDSLSRRTFVQNAACAAGAAALAQWWDSPANADSSALPLGPAQPFDFAALVKTAAERAKAPYVPAPKPAPEIMDQMVYDEHEAIHYRPDRALFAASPYPVIFRHLGKLFPSPVKMYALEGGSAREILYDPSLFTMPKGSVAKKLPKDAGFAGLSFQEGGKFDPVDKGWLCFLGASYFRGVGENTEMGLSARAVAVNTAPPGAEEFPGYVAFYISGAKTASDPVVVHALLDSPSLAGAYRFTCHRQNGVTMEVECKLFLRQDIAKLGIAPLTSMFWYSEYGRSNHIDWRPEVHDSDGLLLWTGAGKRIFRALENYKDFTISTFSDKNPKGFGLTQRDRDQNHFLDPVYYERRPSVWVEPLNSWGAGHVELVEIPTVDEYHDNLVVYWVPSAPSKKGSSFDFSYRLHWRNDQPFPPADLALVKSTYIGRGGEPATPDPVGVTKFVVEFQGKVLDDVRDPKQVSAKVKTSLGEVVMQKIKRVPDTTRYQLHFDVKPGKIGVAELEAQLFVGAKAVSECWRYRFAVGAP